MSFIEVSFYGKPLLLNTANIVAVKPFTEPQAHAKTRIYVKGQEGSWDVDEHYATIRSLLGAGA